MFQAALAFLAGPVQVIAEHGVALSAASLKAMPYLEAVMKETQRRYPIVGGVFRKALRSFELPGSYYIPKVHCVVRASALGHVVMAVVGGPRRRSEGFPVPILVARPGHTELCILGHWALRERPEHLSIRTCSKGGCYVIELALSQAQDHEAAEVLSSVGGMLC